MRFGALAGVEDTLKDLIQKVRPVCCFLVLCLTLLFHQCLERNPAKRINYEGIKKHPFFADLYVASLNLASSECD